MKTTIVTFVNEGYLPIVRNWLVAIARLNLTGQALVVTLDESAHEALANSGVRLLHRPKTLPGLNGLWIHRVAVLSELLKAGENIVHSDADAVWLGDPMPALTSGAFDLVFTQGTIWPPEVHAKRGIVLCCGLYFVRGTPQAGRFFARIAERVRSDTDDQRALNRMVDETFHDWVIEAPYAIPFRDTQFICSRRPITAQGPDVTLAVLPHHAYPRLMNGSDGVIVGHPLSGKTCEETRVVLQQHGLWLLD